MVKRQGSCVGDGLKIVEHLSWSNYSGSSLISRVHDHERIDEANFQGEFNGVPGQRGGPNQCPKHTIISDILTNPLQIVSVLTVL